MDYSLLTEKDLEKRYNYLPSKLRAILDSKEVLVNLDTICRSNHIEDEAKKVVAIQLFSLVLLGVIHIDDLAKEIDEVLLLNNYKFSKAFADEITRKIFEPVRSEIEKNYRPFAQPTKQVQMGAAAVAMKPAEGASIKRPVSLGELESKGSSAKPFTPPSFSPQSKPSLQASPSFKPPLPPQRTTSAIPRAPIDMPSSGLQSKNPPLDLSEKQTEAQSRYNRNTAETQSRYSGDKKIDTPLKHSRDTVEIQLKDGGIKKEAPAAPAKDTFGMGAEIQKLERAGNELVEVLKKREEEEEEEKGDTMETQLRHNRETIDKPLRRGDTMEMRSRYDGDKKMDTPLRYSGNAMETQSQREAPIQPGVPKQTPLEPKARFEPSRPLTGQGPVMIHQETATAPIRPNVDFKLNFPQARPVENFTKRGEVPNMAKIEIGGVTERQLERMTKSTVIQPPKVIHYSAFQTPANRDPGKKSEISNGAGMRQGGYTMEDGDTAETQSQREVAQTPLSQSPFIQTGKGLGDMRMEGQDSDKSDRNPDKKSEISNGASMGQVKTTQASRPSPSVMVSQRIKTVDFMGDKEIRSGDAVDTQWKKSGDQNGSLRAEKPKKDWFSRLFGKKEEITAPPIQLIRKPIAPPAMPVARSPLSTPPPPPRPQTQASNINTRNIGNFAGIPKEQLPATPKTQDIKPLGSQISDNDIIDLNTMQKIKK